MFFFFPQGCYSKHDPFKKKYAPWTAFRTVDYGYTRMTIHNKTHISIEQVDVDLVSEGREIAVEVWKLQTCRSSGPALVMTVSLQLFQFTLSDQSFKPTRQDRMVVWVFTGICISVKMKTTSFYFCAWSLHERGLNVLALRSLFPVAFLSSLHSFNC